MKFEFVEYCGLTPNSEYSLFIFQFKKVDSIKGKNRRFEVYNMLKNSILT